MGKLWTDFLAHNGRPMLKWNQYFPVYERPFERFVDRPVVMWEIGVGAGGSTQMWKRYFGPYAKIVGLDIDPASYFEEDQITILIGDQSNPDCLEKMWDQHGPPDIVLDDGSHQMAHIDATFDFAYPIMDRNGVYIIEDLHTAYWPEYGGGGGNSFIERSKKFIDLLNADHWRDPAGLQPDFTRYTMSMHFYDSMVVFERGYHEPNRNILMGY